MSVTDPPFSIAVEFELISVCQSEFTLGDICAENVQQDCFPRTHHCGCETHHGQESKVALSSFVINKSCL